MNTEFDNPFRNYLTAVDVLPDPGASIVGNAAPTFDPKGAAKQLMWTTHHGQRHDTSGFCFVCNKFVGPEWPSVEEQEAYWKERTGENYWRSKQGDSEWQKEQFERERSLMDYYDGLRERYEREDE